MDNIFVEFLPPWIETNMQPAFYDKESGTCLQQTARMYDRVNMLVRMFNKLSKQTKETVEEYIDKFNELHDYVMDYFENLDVQEEINNKLDDMVEQGTLQEIIADYLNSKAVFGFDSVSAMKSATNFVDGSYAETLGYYSKNDGGKATYKIRKMTNDDVIDEKFIIEITGDPSNELIAELITEDKVNICCVGGQQNFSQTCNYLISKGYNVYVPSGEYTAETSIELNKGGTIFESDGKITFSEDDSLFKITTSRNVLKLNNICYGNSNDDSTFIEVGSNTNYILENNIYTHVAYDFGTAFKYNPSNGRGIAYNKLNFDYVTVSKYGIWFTQGSGANWINENYFEGGYIEGKNSDVIGIKFSKGADQTDQYNGNVFEHFAIETHYDTGIDLEFSYFNIFENFRLSEGLDGDYYISLSNDSSRNRFSTKSRTEFSKINVSTSSYLETNEFDIFASKGGSYIANKFRTVGGKFVVEREDTFGGYGSSSQLAYAYNTTTPTEPTYYINGGTTITLGHDAGQTPTTFEHILPNAFWAGGVSSFYLCIYYLNTGDSLVIKDFNGNTVADRTSLGSGNISNKWYKIEYVGQLQGNRWKVTPIN